MPYNLVFKHVTISEYIIRKKYLHPIILAPLSFQSLVIYCYLSFLGAFAILWIIIGLLHFYTWDIFEP